jgi:hypothetical protein
LKADKRLGLKGVPPVNKTDFKNTEVQIYSVKMKRCTNITGFGLLFPKKYNGFGDVIISWRRAETCIIIRIFTQ